ncbi:MAG: hypothetical protein NXI31_16090 [bacterium]|nr:hypothetical protein [bacterium]
MLLSFSPTFVLAQEGEAGDVERRQEAQAAHDALVKDLTKGVREWQRKAQQAVAEARKNNKPLPAIAMTPPTEEYLGRAFDLAKEHAGEDTAILFHGFVLKYAGSKDAESVKKSLVTLTLDHAASPTIGDALGRLGAAMQLGLREPIMELFTEVIDTNPSAAVKGTAMLERGKLLLAGESEADKKKGLQELEAVAKMADKKLAAAAEKALFPITRLQVGCEAPDIVGKDVDGVAFKLSDYRGKAVLLDFWGFW